MAYTSTVLTEETVTTSNQDGKNVGYFTYNDQIDADVIYVTFNGTRYECPVIDNPSGSKYYGGAGEQGPVFTEFPFVVASAVDLNELYTETPGTYTVKIEVAVKTIMHSTLARDPRFELVFESDDMPTTANGWEALSGGNAKAYLQDLSEDADHDGTVETDNRFKYFFFDSSATVPEDPVISGGEPTTPL